jgi:hypothetical protein
MAPALSGKVRSLVKRLVAITALGVVTVLAISWLIDYAVFRYRVSANRGFAQVTVNSFDAVKQKNGKTEFIFDPPQVQTCANALFPRAGYLPCWYLQRHAEQRTDI